MDFCNTYSRSGHFHAAYKRPNDRQSKDTQRQGFVHTYDYAKLSFTIYVHMKYVLAHLLVHGLPAKVYVTVIKVQFFFQYPDETIDY